MLYFYLAVLNEECKGLHYLSLKWDSHILSIHISYEFGRNPSVNLKFLLSSLRISPLQNHHGQGPVVFVGERQVHAGDAVFGAERRGPAADE